MFARLRRLPHLLRLAWGVRRLRRAAQGPEKALAQAALARALGGGRGMAMKIGQVYADRSGASALDELLHGIEPLPLTTLLPLIEQALDAPPERHFAQIEPHGIAASLGQVHRATLHNGSAVAIKVRYPDIQAILDGELALAGLIPGVGPAKRWGFDLEGYRQSLRDNFERELDYLSEARRQQWLREQLCVPGLVIPEVLLPLCRDGLLVQRWEAGEPLRSAESWPLGERLQVARTLLQTLFQSLFTLGELHGDPHAGNLRVRRGAAGVETLLYDFGCTLSLARERRLGLLRLILALRGEAEPIEPLQGLIAIGFDVEKLAHVAAEMPALMRLLLRPFLLNAPFDPAGWGLSAAFEAQLGVRRWWFRSAGPADVVLLLRIFQGLFNHLERLDAKLPWWPLLVQAVGEETLAEARALVLPTLPDGLSLSPTQPAATRLRVQLYEGERLKVDLELPADATAELESLIPEETLAQINAQQPGVVAEACARAQASGLVAQGLFAWEEGARQVRVWLE